MIDMFVGVHDQIFKKRFLEPEDINMVYFLWIFKESAYQFLQQSMRGLYILRFLGGERS